MDRQETHLDWGIAGALRAAGKGDIVVVVDTLSFSTAVAVAVSRGASIFPSASVQSARAELQKPEVQVAVARERVSEATPFSLSPATMENADKHTRIVMASPNGGACAQAAREASYVLVGALINAQAVARAAEAMAEVTGQGTTVIACGEVADASGELRFALEDYLASGAILAEAPGRKTPEALACAALFRSVSESTPALIWDCESGRELRGRGYEGDVRYACVMNGLDCVPKLNAGWLEHLL
ncbi:MAG TPA: 2-phosphosulfolactate phosphatase [Chthonomonadales bacterium]|nr:2-phosphosulfolactate phosphatase [Chthonomonadales bacterium]